MGSPRSSQKVTYRPISFVAPPDSTPRRTERFAMRLILERDFGLAQYAGFLQPAFDPPPLTSCS